LYENLKPTRNLVLEGEAMRVLKEERKKITVEEGLKICGAWGTSK